MLRWWLCCIAVLMILPGSAKADYKDWLTQDLVFDAFESPSYKNWTLEGNCWGKGPVDASFLEGYIHGWQGRRYLCTSQPSGAATGKATSASFFIPRRYITFLIGGGNHPETCFMQLVVNGKVARTATGDDTSSLAAKRWDVQNLIGQEAHIEIVDKDRRTNGYLLVDHIAFSDDTNDPLADRKNINDMKAWLSTLYRPAVSTDSRQTRVWRMLVLFYSHTDTDYYTLNKEKRHYTGSLKPYQIDLALNGLRKLPSIMNVVSNGYCKLDLDVKVIDRPVTFSDNSNYIINGKNRVTHQTPVEPDVKPEVTLYNTPPQYDAQFVLYYPGPVPQDLAGYGGGGRGGISGTINYGSDASWDPRKALSGQLSVFVHEMSHGFDGFFGSGGYSVEPLHHVTIPRYSDMGMRDSDLFIAIHRGLLVHNGDARYEYSPSVWLSGTPRSPVALPPCQLTSPLPDTILPVSNVEVSWAASHAPDGYEAHFCRADAPGVSLLTVPSRRNRIRLTEGRLPPGDYIWYVQACKGNERSLVADQFSLKIAEPAALGLLTAGQPRLSAFEVMGNGQMVRVRAAVTSPSSIAGVDVEYTHPDGHKQRLPLKRRSFYQSDTAWAGAIWIPENHTGSRFVSSIRIMATDHAGREAVSEPNYLAVEPLAKAPPEAAPGDAAANAPAAPELAVPAALTRPDSAGIAVLRAVADKSFGPNPDGKIWAEITGDNGVIDYAPLLGKEWDEGDWRTGSRTPRQAFYRFPITGGSRWSIVYAARDASGRVYRTPSQPFVYTPPSPGG